MSHPDLFPFSCELLNRIGLGECAPPLLGTEDYEGFEGDLAPVLRERYQQSLTRHAFVPGDLVTR